MTDPARVTVRGADTVAMTLGVAGRHMADLAPTEVGALITDRSRMAAPFVTGRLRASIRSETESGRIQVGSALEYAGVIHNGWAGHNIRANPYLIPVAENLTSVWGPMYTANVARILATDVRGA